MRTKKAIMKSISGLSTRSSKIKADYQVALCEAAGHAYQYKDVTLFESILDGASGMNLQLMLKWVRANGFALVDSKTGKCTSNKSALREADFVDGDCVVEYLTAQDAWFVKAPSVAAEAQAVDILARLKQQVSRPLAVYQVSGEYAMIKHAAAAGAIDEQAIVLETLTSFKRAGADLILTYFAVDVAGWLQS